MTENDRDGSTVGRRVDLPLPLTSTIGREADVAAVHALIDAGARLVTLLGPGGVGKTRLAVEVGRALADEMDLVLFVPLAAVDQVELVLPEIARALQVAEGEEPLARRIARRLAEGRTLLILDNLERLLPAAEELPPLLERCAGLTIVATSRAPLNVTGERRVEVAPLATPAVGAQPRPSDIVDNPAVRLFVERAGAVRTGFALTSENAADVADVCRRLDGLPLAIELAAARLNLLTPRALRDRLGKRFALLADGPRDAPPRLRSLRDAIAWSYDLLDEPHQALFRRLAICAGGFNLEAVDALVLGWGREDGHPYANRSPLVWVDQLPETGFVEGTYWSIFPHDEPPDDGSWLPAELPPLAIDALAGLALLVSHSLVRPAASSDGAPRFEMLETIRAFGVEQLALAGETDAVAHAHATYFVGWGEVAAIATWSPDRRLWNGRLESDLGNLRAAHAWLAAQPGAANHLVLRLAEALWPFWQTRGHTDEGWRWLKNGLGRGHATRATRAAALNEFALLTWFRGDADAAEAILREALVLWREEEHLAGSGRARFFLALVAWRRNDFDAMIAFGEAALDDLRTWNDWGDYGLACVALGVAHRERGEPDLATLRLAEGYEVARRVEFQWGMAAARYYAGELARVRGERADAVAAFREALAIFWDWGDLWGVAGCVSGIGALIAEEEPTTATRLLGAAAAMTEQAGALLPPTEVATYQAVGLQLFLALGDAFEVAFAEGTSTPAAEAVALALEIGARDPAGRSTPPAPLPPSPGGLPRLTPRQDEVVRLYVQSRKVEEIAEALFISRKTVYFHLGEVCRLWGLDRAPEIRVYALRHGYLGALPE